MVDMNALAKRGAEIRFNEMQEEMKELVAQFGPFATNGNGAKEPDKTQLKRVPAKRAAPARKRMTPKQRKAVAARMKAYWAAKRQEAGV